MWNTADRLKCSFSRTLAWTCQVENPTDGTLPSFTALFTSLILQNLFLKASKDAEFYAQNTKHRALLGQILNCSAQVNFLYIGFDLHFKHEYMVVRPCASTRSAAVPKVRRQFFGLKLS